jgi:hypothetical protein
MRFNPTDNGGYGWRVIAYIDMGLEWSNKFGWIDAGCLVYKHNLEYEKRIVEKEGFFASISCDTVSKWVYNSTIGFMMENKLISKCNKDDTVCSGGYAFYDPHNPRILNKLIIPFYQCCFTKKCISPYGSSRRNHRQDQAVLTLLIHNLNLKYSARNNDRSAIFHVDGLPKPTSDVMTSFYMDSLSNAERYKDYNDGRSMNNSRFISRL